MTPSKRIISLFGLVIAMLLYFVSFMKMHWYQEKQQFIEQVIRTRLRSTSERNQKIVILYSNQRSGSTFMGELFNRNGNSFYLYEPLFPFTPHCDILNQERMEVLERMLRCDFSGSRDAFKRAQLRTKVEDSSSGCVKNSVCFTSRSETILHNYRRVCEEVGSSDCNSPKRPEIFSKICASSSIVAFKVLRVCSLKYINDLYQRFTNEGKDVFVVHLVRDPRAIISSKLGLQLRREETLERTEELCQRLRRNLEFLDNGTDMIDNKKYLRIRYEDAASDPINVASTVYRFLGLPVPKDVRDWINASTLQSRDKLKTLQNQLRNSTKNQQEVLSRYKELVRKLKNPYGTVKDPMSTIQKWRRLLPLRTVMDVQRLCSDVLERLNYKQVKNADELNDFERSLWL